jgi:hypothetical protein
LIPWIELNLLDLARRKELALERERAQEVTEVRELSPEQPRVMKSARKEEPEPVQEVELVQGGMQGQVLELELAQNSAGEMELVFALKWALEQGTGLARVMYWVQELKLEQELGQIQESRLV